MRILDDEARRRPGFFFTAGEDFVVGIGCMISYMLAVVNQHTHGVRRSAKSIGTRKYHLEKMSS